MSELQGFFGPDPTVGFVAGVLAINLALGAAILAVALLRLPVRGMFGADVAYQLWLALPVVGLLATLAVFVPTDSDIGSAAAKAQVPRLLSVLVPVWALGAVAMVAVFAIAQARFLAEVRAGRGGP